MPKFKEGDKSWTIPDNPNAIAAFKKAHPNAVEVKETKKEEKPEVKKSVGIREVEKPSTGDGGKKIEAHPGKKSEEDIVSYDDETGESLPFDKKIAGKGDDSIPLDIKPWYGDVMKTNYSPEQWKEFVKSTGFKPTTKNTSKNPRAQVQEFQWYLAHHPDWKDSISELHSADKGFGKPKKSKRKYDGFLGRRWDKIINKKPTPAKVEEPSKTPAPTVSIKPGTKGPETTKTTYTKRYTVPPPPPTNAPWWMQDIVKTTGAALDLARINRYMPWQATPETYLPEATFYDPTRELAANAEQANIQTQGLAAFTGPQALSARSSAIQGQAAKNAADIMARYNNLNVGIANQLSQERSNIMNQAAMNKANMDTQLWDKYNIANQQFDNAKNMARQNLRQSYIDAITNRAKTQALNTLYPNYYTDPSTGGFVQFRGDPNKIRANRPDLTNDYLDALELTGDKNLALEYLRIQKGMGKGSGNWGGGYDESVNYLKNQRYPGMSAGYASQEPEEG